MKNSKARSFVIIMVVIGILALLLRITIEKLIKINIAQNESYAQTTLKLISAALESYANNNRQIYPSSITSLTQPKPPYLDKDYLALSPLRGYSYSCSRLESSGYNCSAVPSRCRLTGGTLYTVTTGGLIVSEECNTKE